MGETKIVKAACGMCIEECGIDVHVEDGKIVRVEGMAEHPYSEGFICVKGRSIPEYVYSPARIEHPMRKVDGQWQRIGWEEALDTVAGKLRTYRETDGPTGRRRVHRGPGKHGPAHGLLPHLEVL